MITALEWFCMTEKERNNAVVEAAVRMIIRAAGDNPDRVGMEKVIAFLKNKNNLSELINELFIRCNQ